MDGQGPPASGWLTGSASSRRTAVAFGVIVTFIWATSIVLIRYAILEEDVDIIVFSGVRFVLAAVLLAPLAVARSRIGPNWRAGRRWLMSVASYGLLLFCAAQMAFYVAAGELRASTVGLFMGLSPVVAAMLALRSGHERPSLLQIGGIAVLAVGVVLYFGVEPPGSGDATGLLAGIAVPVVVGGSALLGRRVAVASQHHGGPVSLTAIAMAVGGVATLILGVAVEGLPQYSLRVWLLIVWLAAVNTALAYTLWAQSQRTLRAVESSVLGDLSVVQVALLGWIVLGEGLEALQVLGIAVALIGVVVVQVAPVLRSPPGTVVPVQTGD